MIAALRLGDVLCLAALDLPCGEVENDVGALGRCRLGGEGTVEEGPLYVKLLRIHVHDEWGRFVWEVFPVRF